MVKQKLPVKVHPSILSADFGCLAEEAKRIGEAGADAIHVDVMDGQFVPNLTFGPKAVAAINRATSLFLDVHCMIYNPYDYVEPFVAAGADRITFHLEATEDVEETLQFIQRCGVKAGLAIRPETSLSLVERYLPICDLLLIMTVSPGFGGQKFMPEMLEKVLEARERCNRIGRSLDIQVDGGIQPETARQCIAAGANILVSGDYLFKQPDLARAIEKLREE